MSCRRDVAGGVGAGRLVGEVLLAGALGDDDHGVPALLDGPAQVREEAVLAVELERHLGDQHEVGVVLGQRGVAGDEARVPAHQLHQADAVRAPSAPRCARRGSTPSPARRRSGSRSCDR